MGLLFSICLIDPSTFLFFLVYVSLHVFVVYSIVFLISSLLPAVQTLWLRFGCSKLFGEVRPENLHEKIGEVRWEKNQWSLQIVKITTVENWGWVLKMLGEIFSLVRGTWEIYTMTACFWALSWMLINSFTHPDWSSLTMSFCKYFQYTVPLLCDLYCLSNFYPIRDNLLFLLLAFKFVFLSFFLFFLWYSLLSQ